ncbi:XMAS2 protein, partial [Pseudoatta argentina]
MDKMEMDTSETDAASNSFVFSKPNAIFDLSRVINFGVGSDHVFDTQVSKKNMFTFAFPTIVSQCNQSRIGSSHDEDRGERFGLEQWTNLNKSNKYKPRISRNTYKPTINVFANALKDTGAFEQLKKNSRSRITKVNIDNSITCSNVPKTLLTKTTAKEYFIKYGKIIKITIRPKKNVITVIYATKIEASAAYYGSGDYKGEKFDIEWTKLESTTKRMIKKKELQHNIVANLLKASDDEIKSELEAMANIEYNLHPIKGNEVSDVSMLFPIKGKALSGKTLSHEKAMGKLEKVAMKIEKHDTESQTVKSLPGKSIEELQNIIHQVALTVEDKYKVLEARDRLMRLKRAKPVSLAMVTSGTCADMCPEKERLMRESQRQVASYEQLEGNEYRINHAIAIKQYSRSSADQEEPMPHELRPVKSLKMTMSYLLHELMDLCEQEGTNLAEWYHFLWDRTRGIRKDITQQELCCKESVELIEQCARFHVVCSERLCAEDASVFDKKINSENLTKCLQTLKYMYHDLRVKGITCGNEPEFRAYIVLLNLNNGNFLYDLQQLPVSVQNSPQVQFAIKVYFSLDSNNYYKFFKLVRETTYLNACILLRYFNQIRLRALSIMVKAYCRTTSTAFPLYELIDILGFEDENEAIYFCEQAGLNLSNDEMYILLNRQSFNMPTASIQQGRACNLIESKRITLNFSIGQCIAGKKMPEKTYKNHKPHNSFDMHGYLMPESINAADQTADSSSAERPDPYEFVEKEDSKTKRIEKVTSIRNKDQRAAKDLRPVQTRKTTNANNEASAFKHASVPESVSSDVFKTVTSCVPDVFEHKTKESNVFIENKAQVGASIKVASEKYSDSRSTTSTRREDTNDKQQSAMLGSNNIISNNLFVGSPSVFSTPETSHNAEPVPPFAMAVNKSIFSGVDTGNLFRNVTPSSTIFVNKHFPIPVSVQQSVFADVASKTKKEQSVFHKKEQKTQEEVISESEKARLEKLEHARRMQRIEEQSERIYNSLHAEVMNEFCSIIAKQDIDKIEMYNTLSKRILSDMIGEVTHEICDTILTAEIEQQKKLQAMLLRIKNRVIVKCVKIWKQYVLRKKRQRAALEDTPVWLQRHSVEETARMLYTKEQEVVMQNICKRRGEQPEDVAANTTETLAPIEIIVYAGIKENIRSLDLESLPNVYWKLVISWPDLANKAVLWYHKKVMNEYLNPDNFTMDPIVKIYRPNPYETLHVCIRHFEGLISEHHLIGADALLFIADASENYKSIAKRLTRTILSRHKLMPMPLAFIVLGNGDLENQNDNIVSDLESYLESGYVSEYTIMYEENLSAKIILNLTQSAVLWLTMNKSPSNPLEMDYLFNVYDICLSEELWLRILGDSMYNKQLSDALKDPNFVIDLHNEAVNHLIDIILDPESMLYTNFAPELKKFLKNSGTMPCSYEYFNESWKRDEYRAKLETTMNSFVLPPWNAPWPITDIQDLRRHIMNYCREVLSDSNCNIVFCDILSNLFLTSGSLQVSNFVHILLYIIKEKIRLLDEDQTVIYNRNHIKHFQTLPWWFKSNVLTEFMLHESSSDNNIMLNEPMRKRKKLDKFENNLDDSALDEEFSLLAEFCESTKTRVMEVHSVSIEVENRLQAQQLENELLEDRLKNALLEMDSAEEGI